MPETTKEEALDELIRFSEERIIDAISDMATSRLDIEVAMFVSSRNSQHLAYGNKAEFSTAFAAEAMALAARRYADSMASLAVFLFIKDGKKPDGLARIGEDEPERLCHICGQEASGYTQNPVSMYSDWHNFCDRCLRLLRVAAKGEL